MNRRATPNRAPILILLAVMVVAALLVGRVAGDSHAGAEAPHSRDVVVPAGDALSSSWYCAGGTSSSGGVADETIILGNVGTTAASATVTVTPGDSNTDPTTRRTAPASKDVTVDARSTLRVPVSSILAVAEAGVMVESRGGQLVVGQEVTGGGDVSLGPCARHPSTDWSFPAGSTEKGAQDWIALYNPFNDSAKVDVTSYTLDSSETPETPQLKVDVVSSVSVDPNHETVIALSAPDALGRRDPVGVVVHASEGTIVAARRQQFDGFSFRPFPAAGAPAAPVYKGLTLGLGAPGPSGTWVFPEGPVVDGLRETIDILNPGRTKATASVEFHLVGVSDPVVLRVDLPPRQVTRVDPTNSIQRVPKGPPTTTTTTAAGAQTPAPSVVGTPTAHSIVVRHISGPAIFAEQMVATNLAPNVGVTTNIGLTRAASRWAFVPGRLDGNSLDGLRIFNGSDRTVKANLEVYSAGKLFPLGAESRARIPAGTQWNPTLETMGIPPDSVVIVVADGPVYGARIDTTPGFTISNGAPFAAPDR